MLFDGVNLLGASSAENFSITSGAALPSTGNNLGELFYLTTGATPGLYVYKGATLGWTVVGSGSGGGGTWGSITGTITEQSDLWVHLSGCEKFDNKGKSFGYAPLDGAATLPIMFIGSGTKTASTYLNGAGQFVEILTATNLDIAWTNLGLVPSGKVFMFVANRNFTLPAGLATSKGYIAVAPNVARTITIRKIGATDDVIGSINIATNGTVTFTFPGDISFGVGSVLYFTNPVADSVMSDLTITLTAAVTV